MREATMSDSATALGARSLGLALALALAATAAAPAQAQVIVDNAWVRGTVAQQRATGAFMRITSATDAKLVAVQSTAAAIAEVHEMRMDAGVMRMRPIAGLALPANRAVELAPGGSHLMLIDLKRALVEGDTVAITLTVETGDGKRSTVEVSAPVRPLAAAGPPRKH